MPRWQLLRALTLLSAILLCGCLPQPSSQPEHSESHANDLPSEMSTPPVSALVSSQVVLSEYETAAEALNALMPNGQNLPPTTTVYLDDSASYERGYGDALAALGLQCAWLKQASDAIENDESEDLSESLDALESWTNLPVTKTHFEEASIAQLNSALESTRHGNLNLLSAFANSCN